MQAIFWPIIAWIFCELVIKFLIFSGMFALVAFLVPYAVGYLGSFVNASALNSAMAGILAGVWYFLDLFRIDFGFLLFLSAIILRFFICCLSVIG